MTPTIAADLFRSALATALEATAPLLIVMTVASVIVGVLQAATQVQDASVSFTPKLGAALAVVWLSAAWIATLLGGFMHKALTAIPWVVAR